MNGRNSDSGFWQVIVFAMAILLCLTALPGHAATQIPPADVGIPSVDLREIMSMW